LICLGVSVSAVLPLSFDEDEGWSVQQLGSACMAVPWLFCSGYLITYGALFSKLWRINRVLQLRRQAIMIKQVVWPSLVLLFIALLILGLWTGLDPMQWVREETNKVTGESIGQCQSDDMVAFVIPLITVMLIPTVLTAYMAWCTKDVDEEFSETRWIFIMVLVQCEVILFAVPMIALLRDVSTDGRYIGFVLLIWTFPMSTLLLIVGPKVLAFRRARAESSGGRRKQPTRGRSLGEVHVSGLTASGDTAVVTLTPPDSQASHAAEEERRCPINGPHFAEPIDHGSLPADLSSIKE
jgi:gamma-aminobutyric acid type B receptor